jgi:PhoPQ-activated pathogenicity-related protein
MLLLSKILINNNYLKVILLSFLFICCAPNEKEKIYSEELQSLISYVQDKSDFNYTIKDTIKSKGASVYRVKMNSGSWLTKELVNEPIWWHWIDIVIPDTLDTSTSLLFIGGGSKFDNDLFLDSLSIQKAIETKSIISHISNIPFQPLKFISSDSIERYEDNLIAYGWNKFLQGGAKKEDAEWLARFPMTRAVVRAMDVIQEITSGSEHAVKKFFISGASKRGWTTWTTAAVDKRVMGIAPLVIDVLNLVPSFDHHYKLYGDWSPAVNDYVEFHIMDWMNTKEFKKLMNYIEPYQFKELFTMPKLIINGTIDEFFATDSWKFYWEDIPDKKYLQYVPNGNHGLTEGYRYKNIFSFYDRLIHSRNLPEMEWHIEKDVFHLNLGIDIPYSISLWKINNPNSRDFRIWEVGRNWKKINIKSNKFGKYEIAAPMSDGYTASLVEVVFYPNSESPITLTTGTHVLPNKYSFSSYKSKIKTEENDK